MNDQTLPRTDTPARLCIRRAGRNQCFLVAATAGPARPSSAAGDIYARIARTLSDTKMQIVQERIFGSIAGRKDILFARRSAMRECGIPSDGPLTYIEGKPAWGEGLAGVIIRAVSAELPVTPILRDGSQCGRKWSESGAEFLILQNMHSRSTSAAPAAQAGDMIEQADSILKAIDFSFHNVQRTWFYLSDILGWYGPFNQARSNLYSRFGIMPGPDDNTRRLPASTGVSGENPEGSAGAMDLFAIKTEPGSIVSTTRLTNPVQNEAPTYGSAFSRAVVVRQSDCSLIEVSGTAAIDTAGKSLYPGDIDAQIVCTLDKIEALIAQEKAGLSDICAATVFVKKPEFFARFWKLAGERGLSDLPCVCVVSDICREELLFEIDAEAALSK
jgi:enamine deaminase RidA (YjgF/YER057c/UK114 family)